MVILLSRTGKQRALSRLHSVGMSGLQVVVLQPGHQGASQLDGGNPGWLAQVVGGRAQPRGRVESAGPGHVVEALAPPRFHLHHLYEGPCITKAV